MHEIHKNYKFEYRLVIAVNIVMSLTLLQFTSVCITIYRIPFLTIYVRVFTFYRINVYYILPHFYYNLPQYYILPRFYYNLQHLLQFTAFITIYVVTPLSIERKAE